MPRNRRDVHREAKVQEILAVAAEILRAEGYAALSHSEVARRLGLARNAVYWYFPTKDDLFAAATAQIFAAQLPPAPPASGFADRIQWAVDRLAELQPLNHTLHERARHSEAAAELEAAIQEQLCVRLRDLLAPHVDPDRLDHVTMSIVVFIEGLLTHPRTASQRRELLGFILDRLVPP